MPPDAEEGDNCSVSELISSLKSAFRPSIFGRVERMLILREEKFELEKQALRAKMQINSEELRSKDKLLVELEEELEFYRTKCSELSVELDKKKDECVSIESNLEELEFRNIEVEDELKDCTRTCDGLKERIIRLEEDQKLVCERERRAQEKIIYLSEEIKKVERDERQKYVELKKKKMDLESSKRKAENETEVWKKRFKELETRVLRLEEETSVLMRIESQLFGKFKMEPGGLANEVSCEGEEEKVESKTSKIQSETKGETSRACSSSQIKKEMLSGDGKIKVSNSLVEGSGVMQVPGPLSIDISCKPLVNGREEKNDFYLESNVGYGSRVRKQLAFELEGNCNKELASPKPDIVRPAGGIVEISDSEDDKEITQEHTSSFGGNRISNVNIHQVMGGALDNEKEMTSQKCLKRIHSDKNGEENGSRCENFPLTSAPKRKRVSSCIESDDEDKIPIDKLKMKKLREPAEGIHKLSDSPVNGCSVTPTVCSGRQNIVESITLPRKQFIPQRQWEEKGSGTGRNSPNQKMSRSSYGMSGNPISEKAKENELGKVGSYCEDSFIVNGSEVSGSRDDSSDSEDENFKQVLLTIRRKTGNRLSWQYEADMLSSFEANPELCMRAVCALYRQQTSQEKSMNSSLHSNNRGFNKFDALRGTALAEFLVNGDRKGDLVKSVKELEMFDPKALEECKKLARNHSKQLFNIYQNKEDQFF